MHGEGVFQKKKFKKNYTMACHDLLSRKRPWTHGYRGSKTDLGCLRLASHLLFTKWYTRTYHEKLLVSEKANMTLFMERELRFVQKKTPNTVPHVAKSLGLFLKT
jgi:hypothetical protein